MKTKSERIEAVKTVCDAWSKAMDDVAQAIRKYYEVRSEYQDVIVKVTEGWMGERNIEQEKAEVGESNMLEEVQQEYHETTAMQLAVKAKIDELNAIKFAY